jgi:hypothetical protein
MAQNIILIAAVNPLEAFGRIGNVMSVSVR